MKVIALCFLFLGVAYATTFNCAKNCTNASLDCRKVDPNAACTVNCMETTSCVSTSVTCPADQTCTVNCMAAGSCQNVMFKPGYPTNSKGPDVNCLVKGACSQTTIGAESENFFAVNCMAAGACDSTTVRCGSAQVCELHCQPYQGACMSTNLQCEQTKNLCFWDCEAGLDVCQGGNMYCSMREGSPNVCLSQCGDSQSCKSDTQHCTTSNSECYCWDNNRVRGQCPGMTTTSNATQTTPNKPLHQLLKKFQRHGHH